MCQFSPKNVLCVNVLSQQKKYSSSCLNEKQINDLKCVNSTFQAEESSFLCPSCYRYAIRISKLHTLDSLEKELHESYDKCNNDDENAIRNRCITIVFLHLCKVCRDEKGFLLSYAYEFYLETLKKYCDDGTQNEVSKRNLLSRILDQFDGNYSFC